MITIKTDAAFQPKTHQGGIGIQILGDQMQEFIYHIPYISNNHLLEFLAIDVALEYVCTHHSDDNMIILYSDSKIAIDSMEKAYAKDESFKLILDNILKKTDVFKVFFCEWIPDQKNKRADQLARQGLHKQGNYFLLDQNW